MEECLVTGAGATATGVGSEAIKEAIESLLASSTARAVVATRRSRCAAVMVMLAPVPQCPRKKLTPLCIPE